MARYGQVGSRIGIFRPSDRKRGDGTGNRSRREKERFFKGGNAEIPYSRSSPDPVKRFRRYRPGRSPAWIADPFSNDLYLDEHGTFISHLQSQVRNSSCTPLETFGSGKLSMPAGSQSTRPPTTSMSQIRAPTTSRCSPASPPTSRPATPRGRHTSATLTGHIADGGRGKSPAATSNTARANPTEPWSFHVKPRGAVWKRSRRRGETGRACLRDDLSLPPRSRPTPPVPHLGADQTVTPRFSHRSCHRTGHQK